MLSHVPANCIYAHYPKKGQCFEYSSGNNDDPALPTCNIYIDYHKLSCCTPQLLNMYNISIFCWHTLSPILYRERKHREYSYFAIRNEKNCKC